MKQSLVSTFALGLTLGLVSLHAQAPAAPTVTVKIGIVAPLTGPQSHKIGRAHV